MGSMIFNTALKSVSINSNMPSQNLKGAAFILAGKYLDIAVYRSLLQFDTSSLPAGYIVTNAELLLYINRNDYPDTFKTFDVHRILSSFDEDTVTYNSQPSFSATPEAFFIVGNEINTYLRVDVTKPVKEWYEGRFINYGLLIKASDENSNSLVGFYSRFYSNEALVPILAVSLAEPVQVSGRVFRSSEEVSLLSYDSYSFSKAHDVSQSINYTYFVKNTGKANSCDVIMQVSPDSIDWINDSKLYTIPPDSLIGIIPKTFSKYARIAYKSTQPGSSTNINITLQMQI
jgi:hypothetical protein